MKTALILLSTLLLMSSARAAAEETSPWLASVDEALAVAADGDRYILVDLYAEWCGWCKVLEKEVFTSPEFIDFASEMVLLRVDVDDGGEGSELQTRFQAMSLPTTLILDCRGAVASLERFLESYPRSGYRSQARRALTAIRAGKGMECT